MTNELDSIVQVVKDHLAFPKRLRISSNAKYELAVDLVFVAFGVRTGYLVDRIPPLEEASHIFSGIIDRLRLNEKTSKLFENVVHLYEACSGQSYFVNVSMTVSNGDPMPKFVEIGLDCEPFKLSEPPQLIVQTLEEIRRLLFTEKTSSSVVIQIVLTPAMSIAMAGILLGYPVAYFPSATSSNMSRLLSRVPLDLYRCQAQWAGKEHTLFQFSCPAGLEGLSAALILRDLRDRFTTRQQDTPIWTFQFYHTNVVLDSVSL